MGKHIQHRGFNKHDVTRDACQLFGRQARQGYDWWWHSFTAYNERTGEAKPFFIEFFVCNPASGGEKPVFGQLPENKRKGIRPSYVMVKCGAWGENALQLHRFFGWDEAEVSMGVPFSIKADDCSLNERLTYGRVKVTADEAKEHPEYMCDAGEISWKIRIRKRVAYNVGYGAGRLFRSLQAFEMFWHAEGMKCDFKGVIILNGERYRISPKNCYGYADKNWGKDFTSPWVWLSSNNLKSRITGKRLKNSVFDIGGGCPKVGPVALRRKLLSAFWYEGRPFEFNFSKFWTLPRTRFDCRETEEQIIWHVDQSDLFDRMVTDIRCDKKDMLLINYEAPNGKKLHKRLWNGGNGRGEVKLYHRGKLVDDLICKNVGCEYGEYDDTNAESLNGV